ncbi:MAG: hypothetical protein JWQ48_1657 [Conexibacter sp.]|nr:hypothetical protein [Conexibacter sp.]
MHRLSVALLLVAALAVAACGTQSSTSGSGTTGSAPTIHFAKTKFLLHAGLALGAFHRYVYKPFRAGAFRDPLHHRVALVRAAAAGLFVVHEVRIAAQDARASPALSKLFSPLTRFAGLVSAFATRARSGQLDSSALQGASGAADAIRSAASSAGAPITERAPPAIP